MNHLFAFLSPFLTTLAGALLAQPDPSKRDWPVLLIVAASAGVGGLGGKEINAARKRATRRE